MVSQLKDDGSVEVWLNGWHIRFPMDGGEPRVSEGTAPPPTPPSEEIKVAVSSVDFVTFVSHSGWVVELRESDFTVIPIEPEEDDEDGICYSPA